MVYSTKLVQYMQACGSNAEAQNSRRIYAQKSGSFPPVPDLENLNIEQLDGDREKKNVDAFSLYFFVRTSDNEKQERRRKPTTIQSALRKRKIEQGINLGIESSLFPS